VDESVVECGGQPLYVQVGVDAYTRQPVWFDVSLTLQRRRVQVPTEAEKEVPL